MNLSITISCDDINPQKGYRLIGEEPEKWFRELHEQFGCKYNLFIPSNYHRRNKLTDNKGWIDELNSVEFFELCAHGHFHDTLNPQQFGECEWFELQAHEAKYRFRDMSDEWYDSIGNFPKGWRSPGWLLNPDCQSYIDENFEYVALHYDHNRNMNWNCKTFFGHDGIQQEHISIHNENMIMFQSHIAGSHNHNVWNRQNFEQLQLSLEHLTKNYECSFKTLAECL